MPEAEAYHFSLISERSVGDSTYVAMRCDEKPEVTVILKDGASPVETALEGIWSDDEKLEALWR